MRNVRERANKVTKHSFDIELKKKAKHGQNSHHNLPIAISCRSSFDKLCAKHNRLGWTQNGCLLNINLGCLQAIKPTLSMSERGTSRLVHVLFDTYDINK